MAEEGCSAGPQRCATANYKDTPTFETKADGLPYKTCNNCRLAQKFAKVIKTNRICDLREAYIFRKQCDEAGISREKFHRAVITMGRIPDAEHREQLKRSLTAAAFASREEEDEKLEYAKCLASSMLGLKINDHSEESNS